MNAPKGPMGANWNEISDFYNMFAFCELEDTDAYLDAIGVVEGKSVLDVCCGPGRISVLAARRGCNVRGIDSAERMLEYAQANAEAEGLGDHCKFTLLDWNRALPGQNVAKHDIVIASRCPAMMDIAKLSALANETAAVQIFADAPSIPQLKEVLFDGCGAPEGAGAGRPGAGGPDMPGGPMGLGPKGGRKGSAYKAVIDKVYEAGYDPNVRILPERFRKTFASAEEACAWVCSLDPERGAGHESRVAKNIEPLLHQVDGGVELVIATAAAIIWWDVRGAAAVNPWVMGVAE